MIQVRKAPEDHVSKEKDLEGHLTNETEPAPPGAPASPPAKPAGEGHEGTKEKDLENHLANETHQPEATPAEEEPEGEAEALSDEEDFQLQRALDLLKTWDIFQKTRGAATAQAN